MVFPGGHGCDIREIVGYVSNTQVARAPGDDRTVSTQSQAVECSGGNSDDIGCAHGHVELSEGIASPCQDNPVSTQSQAVCHASSDCDDICNGCRNNVVRTPPDNS